MKITYRIHAIKRMFERAINSEDVRAVIENGETIESYPQDTPYPTRLILGWSETRPIHVVAADNPGDEEIIVVTVYEPEPDQWNAGFKTRRKR